MIIGHNMLQMHNLATVSSSGLGMFLSSFPLPCPQIIKQPHYFKSPTLPLRFDTHGTLHTHQMTHIVAYHNPTLGKSKSFTEIGRILGINCQAVAWNLLVVQRTLIRPLTC